MDVLQMTQEGLSKILHKHKVKQKKISSIRSSRYIKHGLQQITITDEDRQMMIEKENKQYNKECSLIIDEVNQKRAKAGVPAIINPYKN